MRILLGQRESQTWPSLHSLSAFFHLPVLIFVLSLYRYYSLVLSLFHPIGLKQTMSFKKNIPRGSYLQRVHIYFKLNSSQTSQVYTPEFSLSINVLYHKGYNDIKNGVTNHQVKSSQPIRASQNQENIFLSSSRKRIYIFLSHSFCFCFSFFLMFVKGKIIYSNLVPKNWTQKWECCLPCFPLAKEMSFLRTCKHK